MDCVQFKILCGQLASANLRMIQAYVYSRYKYLATLLAASNDER